MKAQFRHDQEMLVESLGGCVGRLRKFCWCDARELQNCDADPDIGGVAARYEEKNRSALPPACWARLRSQLFH